MRDNLYNVLVVGGGITGITAAIEASEAGCEAIIVERSPYLGGRVARMYQYFPKLCPPLCGLEINLRRLRTSTRIRCLTLAEVAEVQAHDGRYLVTVEQQPRFVNERCTGCGDCVAVCPESRPDAFNYGMGSTRAIFLPNEWPGHCDTPSIRRRARANSAAGAWRRVLAALSTCGCARDASSTKFRR